MTSEAIARSAVDAQLQEHWALDPVAAAEVSSGISELGVEHIGFLLRGIESQTEAIRKRNQNREEIAAILRGESDKHLIIIGPCSLDNQTEDYDVLLDYIEELQAERPDAIIALRANGAKPRTGTGSTGLYNSTNPADRKLHRDINQEAFERGIAVVTEITGVNQFAALAPYLSAAWLGARDMMSTELRKLFSATRLPVLVKNGLDGSATTVEYAVRTIRSNTEENRGSGVDLGFLASTYIDDGIPMPVTVGQGNPNVGIIARGHDLPERLGPIVRRREVFKHIGELCAIAKELHCTVLIDGSHSVPPMLQIERSNRNRFPQVLDIIFKAAKEDKIPHFNRVSGLIGEIGTWEGTTDKYFDILSEVNRRRISLHLERLRQLKQKLRQKTEHKL